jgi:hypothetical protein
MSKVAKTTVPNNGMFHFPNGKIRFNTCFILAIRDALIVNNIQMTEQLETFIRELVEMIVEMFEWNKPIDTFIFTHENEFNRFRIFLTEHFPKNTNCSLGIANKQIPPQIFGSSNNKIIWIEQQNLNHYEAVKEWI